MDSKKTCKICRRPKTAKTYVTTKGTKVNLCQKCLDEYFNTHPCHECNGHGFVVERSR